MAGRRATSAGRALLHDPAVLEHEQPVGEHERLERVVRDEQARPGEVGEVPLELGLHVEPGAGVERGQRLVEQQQRRVAGQGTAERHPLRLPAGQVAGPTSRQVGEPEPLQPLDGDGPRRRPAQPARPRREGHVVEHAEVREEPVVLEDEADRAVGGLDEGAALRRRRA